MTALRVAARFRRGLMERSGPCGYLETWSFAVIALGFGPFLVGRLGFPSSNNPGHCIGEDDAHQDTKWKEDGGC